MCDVNLYVSFPMKNMFFKKCLDFLYAIIFPTFYILSNVSGIVRCFIHTQVPFDI